MKAQLHQTKNNLQEEIRHEIILLLNQHLADVLDLGMQAKD
jgi:hypothetical protein